jgi:hypothetical protein
MLPLFDRIGNPKNAFHKATCELQFVSKTTISVAERVSKGLKQEACPR